MFPDAALAAFMLPFHFGIHAQIGVSFLRCGVKRLRKIFRKTGLNFDLTLPLNSQTRYRNAYMRSGPTRVSRLQQAG
ncbi:hypothetical protein SAMN05192539_10724 [Paraburkholderia diazotrophica]|uniref:Uncharacterized protein n=1 Tax=Paraburkholderia diazotrophica TaxID=667676 RepID=A0A1H7EI83_9BURK|nr:hypothetical protein SAMN05192539_10724 [Paraburkholderia diazotrophica]